MVEADIMHRKVSVRIHTDKHFPFIEIVRRVAIKEVILVFWDGLFERSAFDLQGFCPEVPYLVNELLIPNIIQVYI